MKDESLRTLATRIQARAIRRCGELLKQVLPSPGGRPSKTGGSAPPSSRKAVATAAKLSRDQQRTALRVASIPKAEFERQVESEQRRGAPDGEAQGAGVSSFRAPVID